MDSDLLWLTDSELRLWRHYLECYREIVGQLDLDLSENAGLSLAEYEVLVHLSESTDGRSRMSQLADAMLISRSGLTRRVDRMVRDGLVVKEVCLEDRRGTFATLTPDGWDLLKRVAPMHVAAVRSRFVGRLKQGQQEALMDALIALKGQFEDR